MAYMAPMLSRSILLVVVLLLAPYGCAAVRSEPQPPPPPPSGIVKIEVETPTKASGVELPEKGKEIFGFVPEGGPPPTIIENLATRLRAELVDRGFELVVKKKSDAPELRTEIRGWSTYQVDYSFVTVDVTVTLVDGKTGATLWTDSRSNWNVPTHGEGTPYEAGIEATHRIAKELVGSWTPDTGATPQ